MDYLKTKAAMIGLTAIACMTIPHNVYAENQSFTESGTMSVDVELIIPEDNWTILLPDNIIMDPITGIGSYDVGVYGRLSANKCLEIKPSSEEIIFKDKNDSEIIGTVTQEKTLFEKEEVGVTEEEAVSTSGIITISDFKAGAWNGSLEFVINYLDKMENEADSTELEEANAEENQGVIESGEYQE